MKRILLFVCANHFPRGLPDATAHTRPDRNGQSRNSDAASHSHSNDSQHTNGHSNHSAAITVAISLRNTAADDLAHADTDINTRSHIHADGATPSRYA